MKWYTILSTILFSLNSVVGTVVLSLAVYHLLTNQSVNAPTVPNEAWMNLVKSLVSLSALWMVLSITGIFISMMRRQILLSSLVLVFYGAVFGGAIYFTVAFASQLEMEDVKAEDLFATVLKEISIHSRQLWIPPWLDNIQKQSKQCCGIVTYRDFEDFWPATPTKIARSCCRDPKDLPDYTCPEDLTKIPFPNTPDNYLKVEVGCMQEINEATRRHVKESLDLCITMTTFLACGLFGFAALYIYRYIIGNNGQTKKRVAKPTGSGDSEPAKENLNVMIDSAPIFVASSRQVLGSINSFSGIPDFASFQSMVFQPEVPEPPPPPKELPPEPLPLPPSIPLLSSQPSVFKTNKANTVFAGLENQKSTGDDMTVGGGNLGSREVFYVQEKEKTTVLPIAEKTSGQRLNIASNTRLLPSSSQNDLAGDIIHVDSDPPVNPPSSREKEKKKRKGKKFGMLHNHHH